MRNPAKIILSVFLLFHCLLQSQQLRFKSLTSEAGLSTNFVRCVLQDDRGFMWFGTQDGLNRYDGFGMKIFKNRPTDTTSLPGSDIISMRQLQPNLILVGTSGGLAFFNPVTETARRLQKYDERLAGKINAVLGIDGENAAVGTGEGLYMVDTRNRIVKKSIFDPKKKINVHCIEKIEGTVYIGTLDSGLWKLKSNGLPERVSLINAPGVKINPAAPGSITCIKKYKDKVYLGTMGYGIIRVNQLMEIEAVYSFASFDGNSDYIAGIEARDNELYVASANGLLVYNLLNNRTNYYTKKESAFSINANNCTGIYIDTGNNCWVSTDLGGINIAFSSSLKFPVSNYNYETNFSNIFSFYEHAPGQVLLGGAKTFHLLDLKTGDHTSYSKFLGESGIALCIARESEDVYWIGTWGGGIYRYDIKKNEVKSIFNDGLGGTIVCLKIEGGYLYAGSVGDGLFKIDLKTYVVTRFTENDGLPVASVNCIYKDSKGKVWLGTYDGGLVKMSGFDKDGKLPIEKIYRHKGETGQIAANAIMSVNEDTKGNIWVATTTGLSKLLPDDTFYSYYEKDGLLNSYLYSLLRDSLGNFWMSSNSGVTSFNPQKPESEITFKNYGVKDGLVNSEYSMGAAFISTTGTIYFGGTKGFNAFRPAAVKDNPFLPRVYVVGYKRAGKDVKTDSLISYKKHLKLSWRENYFQFELAALDYTDPAKNKFSYMLDGYDKEWSEPTTVRYVSYTELPGGEYTFKVKAANNDGVWNEKPFEIKITVVPPFWKTKAFYILIIVLGIGGVVTFTQYRTRAIKKENKILEAKVAERTKELHEKNLDITSSIEYAKRIQEAILPSKDHIFSKLGKAFILYRPKDIVSGDFYWFGEKNGIKIFAVVDCTGHGVPGAFMSMIGHNLLNQIVMEKAVTDPGDILNYLHRGIQGALRQGHNEISTNDGMDVSMLTINSASNEVKWAGANRPLILIDKDKNFSRLEGDKFPVGGAQAYIDRVFTTRLVEAPPGAMAYMFSDGYADQFGGEKGKKFMVKRLHEILTAINLNPADAQKEELEKYFLDWKKDHEQVDDVLVVGIEI